MQKMEENRDTDIKVSNSTVIRDKKECVRRGVGFAAATRRGC